MSEDMELRTVAINIPEGKDLKLVPSVTAFNLSYLRVGNGAINRGSGMQSIDILEEMEHMTLTEMRAFNVVRTNVSWERDLETGERYTVGIAYIPASYFDTDTKRRAFRAGIKVLKDKDLVIKVGRNDYMLNPRAIIPTRLNTALHMYYKDRLDEMNVIYDRELKLSTT